MSKVNINIDEATVTAIHEFNSRQGYGLDIFIEAKDSSYCTVYLQMVLYDDRARKVNGEIHVGDTLEKISGALKVKKYPKDDGTPGWSLVIENPDPFHILSSKKSDPQVLYRTPAETATQSETANQGSDVMPESTTPAYETDDRQSQAVVDYSKPRKFIIDGKVYEAYDDPYEAQKSSPSADEDELPF